MEIIIIIAASVVIFIILQRLTTKTDVHSNWLHYFEGLKFSTQDFYKNVEEALSKHKLPDVSVSRINLSEVGVLSANREYLRVARAGHIFYICAAPFGTDFFISWWFVQNQGIGDQIAYRIPLLAALKEHKTFYELDTLSMFKEGVHSSVLEVIESITKSKGVRGLLDLDRKANFKD